MVYLVFDYARASENKTQAEERKEKGRGEEKITHAEDEVDASRDCAFPLPRIQLISNAACWLERKLAVYHNITRKKSTGVGDAVMGCRSVSFVF